MKYIGAHVSVAKGVENAPLNAHAIGAKAFALFTGSSARWASPQISDESVIAFKNNCNKFGYSPDFILPHDNFLINLGSGDPKKLAMSRKSFLDEMKRCELLGLNMLNFHPGSHLKLMTPEECLDLIAESINITLQQTSGVTAVIENTAGQGTNLGYSFPQIARIINHIEDKSRVGVCIDTCHAYSAGYDLLSPKGYEDTWKEFDEIIGPQYLKALHVNDDKKACGSRIDRHECLGKGTLGKEFFERMMNDSRFDNIPLILETPDDSIWEEEIKWLYSLENNTI